MTDTSQPTVIIAKTGHKFAPRRLWDVIAPKSFVIFKARSGDVAALGDKMFILAVFPETRTGAPMSQPDPGTLGNCAPQIAVAVENLDSQSGNVRATYTATASPYISQVESSFRVRFQDQADLYTSTGAYNKPWVFVVNINAGMKSASVIVQSMTIPTSCNYNATTFINTGHSYPPAATYPSGVQIDSVPPVVLSYKTSAAAGSYTTGARIEIIVRFSRDVVFSQLPDPFSQAAIDAAAIGDVPSGCPYVQLNSNAYAPLRGYALSNDQKRLLFIYEVKDGEETPAGVGLDLTQFSVIQLNGGIIKSARTGQAANFTSMSSAYGGVGESTSTVKKERETDFLSCICCALSKNAPYIMSRLSFQFGSQFDRNSSLHIYPLHLLYQAD